MSGPDSCTDTYILVKWCDTSGFGSTKLCKRYKSSHDEHGIEDVALEGEESQAHVGENEVLCQEIQQLEQL